MPLRSGLVLMLKIYLAGLAVLLEAIALNVLAGALHIVTWYGFLNAVGDLGMAGALRGISGVEALFLLLLYPAALGAGAYLVLRGLSNVMGNG